MKDELERFIKNQFNITENTEFKFHEMCGLMFVFKQTFFNIDEKITSAEIKPVGIIYEESNEYYFAPLDEVSQIDEIVKEFVEIYLK